MAVNKKFFTMVDAILVAAIVIFSVGGVAYAGLSGYLVIPGIKPLLKADVPTPKPEVSAISKPLTPPPSIALSSPTTTPSPTPSPSPSPSPSLTSRPKPTVISSPTPTSSPKATATPSPTPSIAVSTTPNPTPSPTEDPETAKINRDNIRKGDLATIQVALNQYRAKKGNKVPVALSFSENRTDNEKSALQILVKEGYLTTLPIDPNSPNRWYGYKSTNGVSYYLTASLENTKDPAGKYDNQNYLFIIKGP